MDGHGILGSSSWFYKAGIEYILGFKIENNVLIRCNTDARKVVIPEEVTEIGDYAFYCHFNLVSVTIPKGVKKSEKSVFWMWTNPYYYSKWCY